MKRLFLSFALATAITLPISAWSGPAHACACCSDPGGRTESTRPVDPTVLTTVGQLRFASVAQRYLDASELDAVQGIADLDEPFSVTESLSKGVLTLVVKTRSGKTGTISLPMPSKIDEFFVDPSPGSGGADPVLYKEWRLAGKASMTGMFAGASAKGAPAARLIFHGKGNQCTEATDFASWTLQVSGPSAKFTLFGKLGAPAP